ncbi:Glycine cleavage system H protein [Alteracholeplasma palmae J233]|uniref:Glycine cleavage system H protein n=1 Tax=Alteracholeplasma palmae (strain ATCC 49389 / J233) TaxID=1318466 RepID=U4KKH0_ALTPJ|nr:glycine cleavage system protein H [Alteracholeplasma palmae]CCV64229.1 Glycine cleavage system H protein [Alteracholeplasma palmae J233]
MKKFHKNHLWIKIEGNTAKVGLTSFKLADIGALNFLDLPEEGTRVLKDEGFGSYESTKTTGTFISPVSGVITKVNKDILDNPSSYDMMASEEAILELSDINLDEVNELLTEEEYEAYLENIEH